MKEHTKSDRQTALREALAADGPGDQLHLLGELRRRGIATTQATISRDLQEMGYVKVRVQPGAYRYEKLEAADEAGLWERLRILFHNFVTDIKSTGHLVVIRTSPGSANGVASHLDGLQRPEILGTVAGDDTILVVIDTAENRQHVEQDLRSLL